MNTLLLLLLLIFLISHVSSFDQLIISCLSLCRIREDTLLIRVLTFAPSDFNPLSSCFLCHMH